MEKINCKFSGICKCGHLQQHHRDTHFEEGHGSCKKCNCQRFTWVKQQGEIPVLYIKNIQKIKEIKYKFNRDTGILNNGKGLFLSFMLNKIKEK